MGWTELNRKEQFFIVLLEEGVYVSFLTVHHDTNRKGFYNETDSWVLYGQHILSFQVESPNYWTLQNLFSLFSFLFFVFFFFSLKILSPRRLCLHDLLSPLHSFCIPCWELSVKYLGWSKSTDTNASIYQLFPSWNATTHIMSMFTSWLAIALGRKILWVCSQHSHSLLLFSRCHVQVFATPWTAALLCPPLSPSLLEFMSIESVILANHHILCRPLLLSSIFPSIRVFSNESALCIRWPQYWSFSFSHQSFEWIFRVDFL